MTAKPADSAGKTAARFDALLDEITRLSDRARTETLSNKEMYQMLNGTLAVAGMPLKAITFAYEISNERKQSAALKDRFLRAVNPFYTFVRPRSPEARRRAQQGALDQYDNAMSVFNALEKQYADEAERKAAEEKLAKQLLEERKKLEQLGDAGLPLSADIAVKKPLKFKKPGA